MINIVTWCDSETDMIGQGSSKGSFKCSLTASVSFRKFMIKRLVMSFCGSNIIHWMLLHNTVCTYSLHIQFHSLITPSMHEEYFSQILEGRMRKIIDRMNGEHGSRQAGNDACFTQSMHVIFMSFIVFNSSHPIMHIQNTTISHLLYCHCLPTCT